MMKMEQPVSNVKANLDKSGPMPPSLLRQKLVDACFVARPSFRFRDTEIEAGERAEHTVHFVCKVASFFGRDTSDLSTLTGIRTLDLACGNNAGVIQWQPHLARAFFYVGGESVGVDILPNKNEEFKSIEADLVCGGYDMPKLVWKQFKDGSMDLIHQSFLLNFERGYNSSLVKLGRFPTGVYFSSMNDAEYGISADAPLLVAMLEQERQWDPKYLLQRYVSDVFQEAPRILREGGLLVFEQDEFVKSEGQLVSVQMP